MPVLFASKRKIEEIVVVCPEKRKLLGGKVMVLLFKICQEMCDELFFRATAVRKRRHGLKLQQRRFKLDIRKMFS